MSYFKAEM